MRIIDIHGMSEPSLPVDPRGLPSTGAGQVRVVTSEALFAEWREVRILHRGEEYRLRLTRTGKLILTK